MLRVCSIWGACMSVKLIDNEAFYGFRVRRTVNGKLYQEYFSLKKSGKRLGSRQTRAVEAIAETRDQELRVQQEKSRHRRKAELCFHPDGRVKGISYLVKTEKSGSRTPIFQIGIASELEGKIICTSFSINAHGVEPAWDRAIQTYARHKKISRGSKLYKKLVASMPEVQAPVAPAQRSATASGPVPGAADSAPLVKPARKERASRSSGATAGKKAPQKRAASRGTAKKATVKRRAAADASRGPGVVKKAR